MQWSDRPGTVLLHHRTSRARQRVSVAVTWCARKPCRLALGDVSNDGASLRLRGAQPTECGELPSLA